MQLGSLRRQFTWLLIALVAGQAVLLGLLYHRIKQYTTLRAELRQTDARRTELHALRDAVIDAETGERGFVITGQEEFLQPYRAAILTFKPRLERLRTLAVGHSELLSRLETLSSLVAGAQSDFGQLVDVRRHADFATARQATLLGTERDRIENLRTLANDLDEAEQRQAQKQEQAHLQAQAALINLAFFGFCGGLLLSALLGLYILARLNGLALSLEGRLAELSIELRNTSRLTMRDAAALTAIGKSDADARAEGQATLEMITRMAKDLSTTAMELTSSVRVLAEAQEAAQKAQPGQGEAQGEQDTQSDDMDRIITLAGRLAQSALSIELTTAEQKRHGDGTGALLTQIEHHVKSAELSASRTKQAATDLSKLVQALPGGGRRFLKGSAADRSDSEILPTAI